MNVNIDELELSELVQLSRLLSEKVPHKRLVEGARSSLLAYAQLQFPNYKTPPHIRLLAEKLEAVERGEIKRLAISMPPRHGKTNLTSEFFPAWFMGKNPDKFVIAATYAQELADDFGRKVRNQIADPVFKEAFPDVTISADSSSARRFHTNRGGVYFAVGAGGPITGRGAHVLLIDDPIKGREEADSQTQRKNLIEWYRSVAYTRLMPGAAIILIATRWHEEDLIGWALENSAHEGWEVIHLPAVAGDEDTLGREPGEALWPEAYPVERLLEIKNTIGSREWASLFQQSPTAEDGNIFKRSYWRIWRDLDNLPPCEYLIQSYDTAFSTKSTADCTAITTWGIFLDDEGNPNALLLSAVNGRFDYPTLRQKAQELYKKHAPDVVVIENKASGQSLVQDLRRAGIPLAAYTPDRDKVSRAHSVETLFESGRVWVPDPDKKEYAAELVDQCAAFPNGKHDDLVDSTVMALMRLKQGYFLTSKHDPEDEEREPGKRRRGYW